MPQASQPSSSSVRADFHKVPGPRRTHASELPPRPSARPRQRGALRYSRPEQPQLEQRGRTHEDYPSGFQLPGRSSQTHPSAILETPTGNGPSTRPRQRGALRPPRPEEPRLAQQGEARQHFPHGFQAQGHFFQPHPYSAANPGSNGAPAFNRITSSFRGMWLELEDMLQVRDRMFDQMKEEIEKSSSGLKADKEAALREKSELEANRAEAMEGLEKVCQQARKTKGVREDLEHISTDLSVQLAELNHIQQQVDEQEATLETLMEFKNHSQDQDKVLDRTLLSLYEVGSLETRLQECEARLTALEAELTSNRLASEKLEHAVLEHMADSNPIQPNVLSVASKDELDDILLFKRSKIVQASTSRRDNEMEDTKLTTFGESEMMPLIRMPHHDGSESSQGNLGFSRSIKRHKT